MERSRMDIKAVPSGEVESLPELVKIVPKGSIRVVFWGLRLYIVLMVALVIIGFTRGIH